MKASIYKFYNYSNNYRKLLYRIIIQIKLEKFDSSGQSITIVVANNFKSEYSM